MGFLSGWRSRQTIATLLAILVIALLSVSAFAQLNTGRITGTVTDPSGAVVPNAKVVAVNVKTQAMKEVVTNEQGNYVITAVQPGVYTLTATATGFSKTVINNLTVEVSGTSEANFSMKVGSGSETVEVSANAVAVQTAESAKSNVITMKDIDTLPSLGRTPITLAVFQPGVQVNPGDVSFSRINGQRQGSNNTTLDGIDVNDSVVPRLGLSLTANNTDSVGEFRIITQGAKAEYGRNAGGQVEMITRSGTNTFHGNAFDYLRNTVLNANDYFNKNTLTPSERPKFIQNIFGGSFGGPIKHNRLYVFGNYQGRRTRQEVIRNRTVLTAAAKQGIFTYKDSTGVHTYSIVANDPRGIGIDPQVKKVFAMLPDPNNFDTGDALNTGGFRFNNPSNSFEDQFTIKGDANITSKMSVFLRWSWQRNSSIDSLNSADATFPGQVPGTQGGHRWGNSIGGDYTITNSLVNEFRYGHQSAQVAFNRPARLAGPTWISNLFTDPISSAYAQGRNSPVDDIIDNVTKTWNNHVFKFGMKYSRTGQYGYNDGGIWYNITAALANSNVPNVPAALASLPSGTQTTFQNLYNDVLGRMDTVAHTFYSNDLATFQSPGVSRVRNHILQEHGYYFQDDWKISRNLSLNLGVRWELFLPPVEADGIQASVQNPGQITPTNNSTALTIQKSTKWYNTDWNNFSPRIGFAWDIMGDGKTALRGNYGVFYDRMVGATVSLADGNTPGFSSSGSSFPQTLTAAQLTAAGCGSAPVGDVRFNDCVPLAATPAAPQLVVPVSNRSTSIVLFNPNLRTGYVHSFGLNIQREITRNTIVEAGYIGNLGVKLFMDRDFDQMHIDGDFLAAFKEIQANIATGSAVSATNTLVKIFGSTAAAITALGKSNFQNGNVGAAANTLDRSNNSKYAAAGLSQTYLRSYPQFNQLIVGTNDGRSYYHALQLSVRRNTGALRMAANYTYSKSIDNISVDGNGFTTAIDNYNLLANRAVGDADHRHSFNTSVSYALPFGAGKRFGSGMPKWADTIVGGWEIGQVWIVQDGTVFTVNSQRTTRHLTGTGTTGGSTTWADYNGNEQIGNVIHNSDGTVQWFTAAQIANFAFPAAGTYGTSGRNGFRGPGYFDVDASLVKRFKVTERHVVTFRAEAYNLFNKANFTNPGVNMNNIATGTFGRLTGTTGPAGTSARNLQLTLRYDF